MISETKAGRIPLRLISEAEQPDRNLPRLTSLHQMTTRCLLALAIALLATAAIASATKAEVPKVVPEDHKLLVIGAGVCARDFPTSLILSVLTIIGQ